MRRKTLSTRQRAILRYLADYIDQHGYPATLREIGASVGIPSTSVTNYNLDKLARLGYIQRTARASRGIKLLKVS